MKTALDLFLADAGAQRGVTLMIEAMATARERAGQQDRAMLAIYTAAMATVDARIREAVACLFTK